MCIFEPPQKVFSLGGKTVFRIILLGLSSPTHTFKIINIVGSVFVSQAHSYKTESQVRIPYAISLSNPDLLVDPVKMCGLAKKVCLRDHSA